MYTESLTGFSHASSFITHYWSQDCILGQLPLQERLAEHTLNTEEEVGSLQLFGSSSPIKPMFMFVFFTSSAKKIAYNSVTQCLLKNNMMVVEVGC